MRKKFTMMTLCILAYVATIGVCAAYPPGYSLEQTPTGFATLSTDQSKSPNTSVRMGTVAGDDRAAIVFNGGLRLNTINQLSYWTYTVGSGTFGQLTAWVAIYLHVQPNKTYTDWVADYLGGSTEVFYIQAEPIYTTGDPVLNTWEMQNAFGATPLKWVGLESPDYPYEAPTLSDYISGAAVAFPTPSYGTQSFASREYGSLYIVAIKIRMGYGGPWVNTLAYVDDVTINDYFEHFETPESVLDHFTCYEVQGGQDPKEEVLLSDQFTSEPQATKVKKAKLLCVPCNKNGSEIKNPANFVLKLYEIRDIDKEPHLKTDLLTTDQFGKDILKVKKPKFLAVPAKKEELP